MKMSKKTYYGVRAVLALAEHQGPLSIHALAKQEGLPEDYLEKILQILRKNGIVAAKKGVNGGYALARSTSEVNIWEILSVLDGPTHTLAPPLAPGTLPCFQVSHCQTNDLWRKLEKQIEKTFTELSLEALISHNRS